MGIMQGCKNLISHLHTTELCTHWCRYIAARYRRGGVRGIYGMKSPSPSRVWGVQEMGHLPVKTRMRSVVCRCSLPHVDAVCYL